MTGRMNNISPSANYLYFQRTQKIKVIKFLIIIEIKIVWCHWHIHLSPSRSIGFNHSIILIIIRLIPQGTVDNNLGPDHLTGPKVLDFCRQPTLWLYDLCLEVLTVHGTELCQFGAKAFSILILLMSRIWHSSSRYNL